jgi:CheY-like chemotaxis protein
VITVNSDENAVQYLKEGEAEAFFCDHNLYTADLAGFVNNMGDQGDRVSVVLLVNKPVKDLSLDKNTDGLLILSLPDELFELSVLSVYKHLFVKEKFRSVSGITNPDFIMKLLSGTAHELNNILAGMQGYAELAQLNPDDKKLIKDSFQVVIDSSYRVKNEIKNLRAFARVENPQYIRVSIKDVLSESIDLAKTHIKAKNIELIQNFEKGYLLHGDYDQLIQVFFNILNDVVGNVNEDGTAGIFLSQKNSVAVIKVIGDDYEIDEDDFRSLERIFAVDEPILKVDSKEGKIENRNVLSICNHIIRNHRGSIVVQNENKKKLTYTIELPIMKEDHAPEVEDAETRHAYETITNLDMDILIVDDEEFVRNTMYYFFDKKGCRVTLAEDGEFGLNVAKDKPFDLIFMDYLMPKMGGFEAARKILENNSDVKIVFITGRESLNEEELYKSGVYACIKKPFEMNDLYEIAKKVALEKGIV